MEERSVLQVPKIKLRHFLAVLFCKEIKFEQRTRKPKCPDATTCKCNTFVIHVHAQTTFQVLKTFHVYVHANNILVLDSKKTEKQGVLQVENENDT